MLNRLVNLALRIIYALKDNYLDEQMAVTAGREAYKQSLKNIKDSCALLRRNIHRIEKGLIMTPRKPIFASNYIIETVSCYELGVRSNSLDKVELKWATDVLNEYFSAVQSGASVDKARERFVAAKDLIIADSIYVTESDDEKNKYAPYPYAEIAREEIDLSQLSKLMTRRRSVRWYEETKVPADCIADAVSVAKYAPSACNRQSYQFITCFDKVRATEIAKCAGGTSGFADNIPAIIIVVGDLSAYPNAKDRHLIYIDSSLASMQLMLALEAQGLSTCAINWPDVPSAERKIRKLLSLKTYQRVVMLISVGYAKPEGRVPYSAKKSTRLVMEMISNDS